MNNIINHKGFFPTYGGGHVKAVIPIIKSLIQRGFDIEVLGLTNSVCELSKASLKFKCIAEYSYVYSSEEQKVIFELGSAAIEGPNKVIDRNDAIWYHGIGLLELSKDVGQHNALIKYKEFGRKVFLPVDFAYRLLSKLKPNFIFVTCGQRLEHAFAVAANLLNIKVFRLVDLIGNSIEIDYAATFLVGNELERRKLLEVSLGQHNIIVTGNPNFEYFKDSNTSIDEEKKTQITYFSQPKVAGRNNVLEVFNTISSIFPDISFLYKPHPSEDVSDLVLLSENIKLVSVDANQLIANSQLVITHFSSVGFQAINQNKPLLKINFNSSKFPIDYTEMGCARELNSPAELFLMLKGFINKKVSFEHELGNYINYKQPTNSISLVVKAITDDL